MSAPSPLLQKLGDHLRDLSSVLVCFSGGIDSAVLLAVAHRVLPPGKAVGFTAVSPSLAPSELKDAKQLAEQLGAEVRFVDSHELEIPEYARNESDRCFHCKTHLYELAELARAELGLAHIVNGTNQDDLGDYRPGLVAAEQARVRSAFVELGIGKAEIRALGRELGLEIWDKPAAACLSSRLPYGTAVTAERLDRVARMEAGLRTLGFSQVRVRYHEKLARIEVPLAELPRTLEPRCREALLELGKQSGFSYVTVDLAGYRMGSHNEVLNGHHLKLVP